MLLHGLQVHKASGPDHVPAWLLKDVFAEVAPAMTLVYYASLNQSAINNDSPRWLQ